MEDGHGIFYRKYCLWILLEIFYISEIISISICTPGVIASLYDDPNICILGVGGISCSVNVFLVG